MNKEMKNNIFKTGLLIEGGGTRCSFSAGVLNKLLEENIFINYVIAVSAGASCLLCYLSRDPEMMKKSFTDLPADPNSMSWRSFFNGGGYLQSDYLYDKCLEPGGIIQLDFDAFFANPANYRIVTYEEKEGPSYWTEKETTSPEDLMMKVRASSTLPLFMPPTHYQGKIYYDGGINNGLPIDIAFEDGVDRLLVVRTKTRDYGRPPLTPLRQKILSRNFKDNEKIQEDLFSRHKNYNQTVEILKLMEEEGKAYMICPQEMDISNHNKNLQDLENNYAQGLKVAEEQMDALKAWLKKGEEDDK